MTEGCQRIRHLLSVDCSSSRHGQGELGSSAMVLERSVEMVLTRPPIVDTAVASSNHIECDRSPSPPLTQSMPEDQNKVKSQTVGAFKSRSPDLSSKKNSIKFPEVVSSAPKASAVTPEACISGGSGAVKRQIDTKVKKVNARSLRQWARQESGKFGEKKVGVVENKATSSKRPVLLDTIRDGDVFCERGGRSNAHEGNRRYRALIMEYRSEYQSTKTKKEKIKLSQSLVDQIHNRGGRFLKKVTKDPDRTLYVEIPPVEARLKVSQALRERKALKLTL